MRGNAQRDGRPPLYYTRQTVALCSSNMRKFSLTWQSDQNDAWCLSATKKNLHKAIVFGPFLWDP